MKNLDRPVKITACADGFLSIQSDSLNLKRRLGAALPFYSVNSIQEALKLISDVGELAVCQSPKGCSVEYQIPEWKVNDVSRLFELNEQLTEMVG